MDTVGVLEVASFGIEEQRVTGLIDLTDLSARVRRIGHGFLMDAAVILWDGTNVPRLPLFAVFRSGDQWAIFMVSNDRASLQTVTLGQRDDLYAHVLEGLDVGDVVITNPGEMVRDAVRVRLG
jgi:HlyD family secretion protein